MGKDKTEKKIVSEKKVKKSKKRKVEDAEDAAEEVVESPVKKEKKKKDKKRKAEDAAVEESPKKDKKAKKAKKVKEAEAEESPKKKKKDKKKKKTVEEEAPPPAPVESEDSSEEEEEKPAAAAEESADSDEEDKMVIKSAPKPGDAAANPDGITEVFMGNLSFDIDDASLKEAFKDCGEITNVKWLEHKDTGKFKGCGFISFGDAEMAAKAVGMNGSEVLGREIRVDFAKGKSAGAGAGGGAGGGVRPMQEKPEGCTTLFCGNLNFNIDDDAMKDFFKDCGEVSSIRWLTDRDTGDFKGCGFIEFSDPDASLDKAAGKNGEELMGRAVRLDYAAPRKPREKSW